MNQWYLDGYKNISLEDVVCNGNTKTKKIFMYVI